MARKPKKQEVTTVNTPSFETKITVKNLTVSANVVNNKLNLDIEGINKVKSIEDLSLLSDLIDTVIEQLDEYSGDSFNLYSEDCRCENCCTCEG